MVKTMYTLLVLADDLTGALDTGVQFAKRGIPTQVCLNRDGPSGGPHDEEGALVINTGTRHCSPPAARAVIAGILEQYSAVPYVYKKTDSTLRGHIGAELEALVSARNLKALPFIPAYPNLGRSTRRGRQYLDGLPIDKTAMAADALNPVRHSFIPDIIAEESGLPVRLIPKGGAAALPGGVISGGDGRAGPEIQVYDAETNADLRGIARALGERKLLAAASGCAGFAETLTEFIPFTAPASGPIAAPEPGKRPVLVISGSRHPVSLAQVKTAVEAGVPALAVEGDKLLSPRWFTGGEAASIVSRCGELLQAKGCCVLGTRLSLGCEETPGGPRNYGAAGMLGKLAGPILKAAGPAHLAIFGGDTLLGIMEILGCRLLRPLLEVRPGVVLARAESQGGPLSIAAKSGAFGEPGLITDLINFFSQGFAGLRA